MHFWNKLSTAALMRLTILASLNLLLGRLLGRWDILLHPWFFLSVVTLNLGLYAIMVYTGSLNETLIGMMLGGLVATLGTIAYSGMDPTAFMYGGPYQSIGRLVVDLFNQAIRAMPARIYAGRPVQLPWDRLSLISYGVIDLAGLIAILLGGWLARRLQARQSRRNVRTTPLPLDAGAASPM